MLVSGAIDNAVSITAGGERKSSATGPIADDETVNSSRSIATWAANWRSKAITATTIKTGW
jgi:hypothetical protein